MSEEPPDYDNFMFSGSGELEKNNSILVEKLDQLQIQIEQLRNTASELDERKDTLTNTLTEVADASNKSILTAGHKEEITTNINRLMQRVLTVEIKVEIPRTEDQQEAYFKVKKLLNDLQGKVQLGLDDYGTALQSHLNACSSEQMGPVDAQFQQLMLSCTIDDQKQVKKLLKIWIQAFQDLRQQWLDTCKHNMKAL